MSRFYFEALKVKTFARTNDPNLSLYLLKTSASLKLIVLRKDETCEDAKLIQKEYMLASLTNSSGLRNSWLILRDQDELQLLVTDHDTQMNQSRIKEYRIPLGHTTTRF